MEYHLFLVFLLVSFFNFGHSQFVGNPDDTAKIERPCPTYDLNCIRAFFEKHAHCKKTFGPVPDPIERPQGNFYISRINLTLTAPGLKVRSLNGRVEEFYINRETNKLVIAVEFRNLTEMAENIYFKFHRRAKEPVVTRGFGTITFDSVTTTAVIPDVDDLQLQDAECTTFSSDNTSRFVISPTAAESTDPQPTVTIAEILTNLPTNIQEFFLNDSFFLIATYIQYNICDFGLLLT